MYGVYNGNAFLRNDAVSTGVVATAKISLRIPKDIYEAYINQQQLGASFAGSTVVFYNEGDMDGYPSATKAITSYIYDGNSFYVATAEYEVDTERVFKYARLRLEIADVGRYIVNGEEIRGVRYESISFSYVVDDEQEVPLTGTLTLANNLGFANAEELFKAFVQLFGLTIQVDGNNKIVKAYTFNHIINNKSKAKDWTEKMDMSVRPEVRFVFNEYAKKNYITFKEWNDYTDKAAFNISNETLEKEKELFSINVESSKYIDMIPYYNRNEEGFHDLGASHFLQEGYNVTAEEVVRGYYTPFANVLNKALVIQASFLLTAIDIAEFDVFTPIYLKQYGRYFYVNKIDSWQSGSTCKVELVRLPF